MTKTSKSILVAASMSAGKSSIINALVGKEVLPASNEATTAKIARIIIGKKIKPNAKAYSHSGSIVASSNPLCVDQIRAWNLSDEISTFDVFVPQSGRKLHSMLAGYTLIDTPGANNSRDYRHKEQFIHAITTYSNSPMLYILNATQLGTSDDAEIIRTIREVNAERPIIFALNKVDALDEEKGETAHHYVSNARNYIERLGYKNVQIIPLMAQAALIAKKSLTKTDIARRERNILMAEIARFRENPFHFNSAASAPLVLKKNVQRRLARGSRQAVPTLSKAELNAFVDYTGLSTVSALIMGAA